MTRAPHHAAGTSSHARPAAAGASFHPRGGARPPLTRAATPMQPLARLPEVPALHTLRRDDCVATSVGATFLPNSPGAAASGAF